MSARKDESCPTCGDRYTKRFFLKRAVKKAQRSAMHHEQETMAARDALKVLEQQYQELASMHRALLRKLRG